MPAPPVKQFDEEFVGHVLEVMEKGLRVRSESFVRDVWLPTENIVGEIEKGDGVKFGCELLLDGRYKGLNGEKTDALPSVPVLKPKVKDGESDSSTVPPSDRYRGVVKKYDAAEQIAKVYCEELSEYFLLHLDQVKIPLVVKELRKGEPVDFLAKEPRKKQSIDSPCSETEEDVPLRTALLASCTSRVGDPPIVYSGEITDYDRVAKFGYIYCPKLPARNRTVKFRAKDCERYKKRPVGKQDRIEFRLSECSRRELWVEPGAKVGFPRGHKHKWPQRARARSWTPGPSRRSMSGSRSTSRKRSRPRDRGSRGGMERDRGGGGRGRHRGKRHVGVVTRWLDDYGFVKLPDFPEGIFFHKREVADLAQNRYPREGERYEVSVNKDRDGRWQCTDGVRAFGRGRQQLGSGSKRNRDDGTLN